MIALKYSWVALVLACSSAAASPQQQAKEILNAAGVKGGLVVHVGCGDGNPKVLGTWTVIDQVETIDEFNPDKKMNPGRAPFKEMTFKDKGRTDEALWIWSGNTLMDLDRYQALKMTVKAIDGSDYLFIEAGGFSTRNPVGWQSPLYVMQRAGK